MVKSRVISMATILITHIRELLTLLITIHEPPSICRGSRIVQYNDINLQGCFEVPP